MILALFNSVSGFLRESDISAEDIQLWISIIAIVAIAYKLYSDRLPNVPQWTKPNGIGLKWVGIAIAIALTIVTAFNYFYYSRTPGSWINNWDVFHSTISTRYFDELGYYKLYECTVTLGSKSVENLAELTRVRDLRTHNFVSAPEIIQASDCESVFSESRQSDFIRDIEFWNDRIPNRWSSVLRDKGYNGSPFYTLMYQGLIGNEGFTPQGITWLASIDIFLIGLSFFVVFRTYGFRVAFLAFLFFTVNFPNKFENMGGAILRFDYISLLILGFCALKKQKHVLAGALFAVSNIIRVFPIVFIAGFGLKMIYEFIGSKRIAPKYYQFFLSFGIVFLLAFLLSLTVGGLEAWSDFGQNVLLHNKNTASLRIGLKHLFMLGGNLSGPEGFVSYAEKTQIFNLHSASYFLTLLLFFFPVLTLLPKLSAKNISILLGTLAFFLLFGSTRYYYSVLVIMFLFDTDSNEIDDSLNEWIWLLLFVGTAITYLAWQQNSYQAYIYNTFISGLLAVFFILVLRALNLYEMKAKTAKVKITDSMDC